MEYELEEVPRNGILPNGDPGVHFATLPHDMNDYESTTDPDAKISSILKNEIRNPIFRSQLFDEATVLSESELPTIITTLRGAQRLRMLR
jgi:hypothetical protein